MYNHSYMMNKNFICRYAFVPFMMFCVQSSHSSSFKINLSVFFTIVIHIENKPKVFLNPKPLTKIIVLNK